MNQDQNSQNNSAAPVKKSVTTTIVCKFCGKSQEVTVELPEETNTPKMVWDD